MPTIVATIQGHSITLQDDGTITWTAKADIDGDGTGPSFGDPYYQRDTSLHYEGMPLNANVECYIAVPPAVEECVKATILGSQCFLSYNGGPWFPGVVADTGPRNKLGECSEEYARVAGFPWNPNTGGVPAGVSIIIHPGVPAQANGKTYTLQPLR